jgi:superfamily II DNA or RNA helicase
VKQKNTRDIIQAECLEVALKYKRAGLAVSMGVGKTLIGLKYIDHFQQENMNKLNVLIVAPKLSIFDSWKSDAEKFNINIENADYSTYLSLNKLNPHNYDLVVLDECHSLLSSHETFLANYKGRILGLSGTPPRYSNSEKGQMVSKYCPIMYTYYTDDAIDDSILNDYRIIVHKMPLNAANNIPVTVKSKNTTFYTSEKKNYDYWTKRIMEAQTKKQEQIASVMRMRAMMDYKTKEVYTKNLLENIEDKCIVFCNTQAQADRVFPYSVHSENPESETNLEMFKKDEIDVLSCVLQLNEGVNIPNLKAGIIMHAYGNERKASQRIGRLLRLNPKDKSTVHILCYKDTVDERWINEALKDLDSTKIKYFDVKISNYESTTL